MKKNLIALLLILSMVVCMLSGCSFFGKDEEDEGDNKSQSVIESVSLQLSDITLDVGSKAQLVTSMTIGEKAVPISYSFSGTNVSIVNGVLTALVGNTVTTVTAKAEGFEASFNVTVAGDKGTMTIEAPLKIYTNYAPKALTAVFSNPMFASDVTYTASDSRVAFKDGGIYAAGAFSSAVNVTVTATSMYHTATFTVNVSEFKLDNDEATIQTYENEIIKPENKGGTIFIGDSYFSGQIRSTGKPFWEDFYEDYTDGKHFLMGISSSTVDNWEVVSERIVYPMEPKEIVLHLGFNDAHHSNNSGYEIASRLIALLEEYQEKLPDTKIYYCSVEPKKNGLTVGGEFNYSSVVKSPTINSIMREYAASNDRVTFINTRDLCFKADGTINEDFYIGDLSHPALESYDKIRYLIESARNGYTIENNPKLNAIQTSAQYFTTESDKALTNYYSVSGNMLISNIAKTGAHIQFRFSDTTAQRYLLYDSDKDGKLGVCAPFASAGSESSASAIPDKVDVTTSVVISWQIIVTETTAYFYINDNLVFSAELSEHNYFNIGADNVNINLWDVEVVAKADNESAYNAILAEKSIT